MPPVLGVRGFGASSGGGGDVDSVRVGDDARDENGLRDFCGVRLKRGLLSGSRGSDAGGGGGRSGIPVGCCQKGEARAHVIILVSSAAQPAQPIRVFQRHTSYRRRRRRRRRLCCCCHCAGAEEKAIAFRTHTASWRHRHIRGMGREEKRDVLAVGRRAPKQSVPVGLCTEQPTAERVAAERIAKQTHLAWRLGE